MPPLGERLPLGDNAARVVKTGDAGAPPAASPLHRPPATSPCVFPPCIAPPATLPSFPFAPFVLFVPLLPLIYTKCYPAAMRVLPCGNLKRTVFERPSNHLRITSEAPPNNLRTNFLLSPRHLGVGLRSPALHVCSFSAAKLQHFCRVIQEKHNKKGEVG